MKILKINQGKATLTIQKRVQGQYTVEACSFLTEDCHNLAIREWDAECIDLDDGFSDVGSCFGWSDEIQWNEVKLTPYYIHAANLERIEEALKHVTFTPYDRGDI